MAGLPIHHWHRRLFLRTGHPIALGDGRSKLTELQALTYRLRRSRRFYTYLDATAWRPPPLVNRSGRIARTRRWGGEARVDRV